MVCLATELLRPSGKPLRGPAGLLRPRIDLHHSCRLPASLRHNYMRRRAGLPHPPCHPHTATVPGEIQPQPRAAALTRRAIVDSDSSNTGVAPFAPAGRIAARAATAAGVRQYPAQRNVKQVASPCLRPRLQPPAAAHEKSIKRPAAPPASNGATNTTPSVPPAATVSSVDFDQRSAASIHRPLVLHYIAPKCHLYVNLRLFCVNIASLAVPLPSLGTGGISTHTK